MVASSKKLLKWKTGEAPTGRYRSFFKRSWPAATDQQGEAAAHLSCPQSYSARLAADSGQHDISVHIADWRNDNAGRPDPNAPAFVWRTLVAKFKNIKDAKKAAEEFLAAHPEMMKRVDPTPQQGDTSPNG